MVRGHQSFLQRAPRTIFVIVPAKLLENGMSLTRAQWELYKFCIENTSYNHKR